MQFQSGKQEEEPDRVLPLLNVVFLLLIFFIMTGALHAVDFFNVNPPSSFSELQASLDDTVIFVALSFASRRMAASMLPAWSR